MTPKPWKRDTLRTYITIACFFICSATTEHCSFTGRVTTGSQGEEEKPQDANLDHMSTAARESHVLVHGGTADIDGDGVPDIVVTVSGDLRIMEYSRNGRFESYEEFDQSTERRLIRRDENGDGNIDYSFISEVVAGTRNTTIMWDKDYDGVLDYRQELTESDDSEREYNSISVRNDNGEWQRIHGGYRSPGQKFCEASFGWLGPNGSGDKLSPSTVVEQAKELRRRVDMKNHSAIKFIEAKIFSSKVLIATEKKENRTKESYTCTEDAASLIKGHIESSVPGSLNCLTMINPDVRSNILKMLANQKLMVICGSRGPGDFGENYRNVISLNPYILDMGPQAASEIMPETLLHELVHFGGFSHMIDNRGRNTFDGEDRMTMEDDFVDLPYACGAFCGTCSPGRVANFCLGTHPASTKEERTAAACSRCAAPDKRVACGSRVVYNIPKTIPMEAKEFIFTLPDGTTESRWYDGPYNRSGYPLFPTTKEGILPPGSYQEFVDLNTIEASDAAGEASESLRTCTDSAQKSFLAPSTLSWSQTVSCDDRYFAVSSQTKDGAPSWVHDKLRLPVCTNSCSPNFFIDQMMRDQSRAPDSPAAGYRCNEDLYKTHESRYSCGYLITYPPGGTRRQLLSEACLDWRSFGRNRAGDPPPTPDPPPVGVPVDGGFLWPDAGMDE